MDNRSHNTGIKKKRGIHFDALLVEKFLNNVDIFIEIKEKYS